MGDTENILKFECDAGETICLHILYLYQEKHIGTIT